MIFDYSVELDIGDDQSYTHGLCRLEGVMMLQWVSGMAKAYDHVSNPARMSLSLYNEDGRYSLDDVNAAYYGEIFTGRLIRVRVAYGGVTVTMTELRIVDIRETFGEFVMRPYVQIQCTDKMRELLNFEYYPELLQDVSVDEGLTAIHEQSRVVWPNNRTYFFIDEDEIDGASQLYDTDDVDFDTAQASMAWLGDHLGQNYGQQSAQRLIRDLMKVEIFGMYFFQPRTGMYRFLNRLHSLQASIDAAFRTDEGYMVGAKTSKGRHPYGDGALNHMTVSYAPRKVGDAGSTLYSSDSVPITLQPGRTRKITARFYDPDERSARVGATDVIYPALNTDVLINSAKLGGGVDKSSAVRMSVETTASSAIFTFDNPTQDKVYITKLEVRGTPLASYRREDAESRDGDSIYAYGEFASRDLIPVDSESQAQAIADTLVGLFATPIKVIDSVSVVVTDKIAANVRDLTLGDGLRVANSDESHDKDYIIVGERHRVDVRRGRHDATYTLRAVDAVAIFTIDTSAVDGTHILDV